MNVNEMLRFAQTAKDPERVALLWFLQSFSIEPRGRERFASAFKDQFPRVDLCPAEFGGDMLDAAIHYAAPISGFGPPVRDSYEELFMEEPDRRRSRDSGAFEGDHILDCLLNFMRVRRRSATDGFYRTNVGRAVWSTLEWCLEERRPCFIEGLEGRGKTASARAWYEAHRGEARYVSLPGLGVQRDFFNSLASAYGVPFSTAKAPNEVRFRLRDVIVRSGLLLIIDEAHHTLPERSRAGRPPLIDWIDTELCNAGVAVCLVSTPQFGPRLAEFEERTLWNGRQFRRRFSGRWCRLDEKTGEADLKALAEMTLPNAGAKGIKLAVGYAGAFGRDVSGLFDLIRDADRRARKAGRQHATYADLREAYELDRLPTENAMAKAFGPAGRSAIQDRTIAEPPQDPREETAAAVRRRGHEDPVENEFCRRAGLGCESRWGSALTYKRA